jgi:polyisoprenoid-binding protein YceI
MNKLLPILTVVAVMAAGCSNPADDVPAAKTSDAQKVASSSGVTTAEVKIYPISPESKIGFIGSKVTGHHLGGFKKFKGALTVADGKLTPNQVIEIDTTSLWADNDRLTGHLKSADFFAVDKYPTAIFSTTSIEPAASGHTVTGNLNLHGVTKSISFPATIEVAEDHVAVKAEFSIKRFDFGIKFPGKADDLIRDEVVIQLNVLAKAG